MKSYSIAYFGSSLRSDFDQYSDKDVLFVAEDWGTLKKLELLYKNRGWSISTYTYSKLEYLSKQGSLFVKHLQMDSKILIDQQNRLKNILQTYHPNDNYEEEIQNSIKYFNILKYVPNTAHGFAWFCDCFYVGFRNYLIFKAANSHAYEFSYLTLLKTLENITKDEYKTLKELRVIKRNYRIDIFDEFPSYEYFSKLLKLIYKLDLFHDVKLVPANSYSETIISFCTNEKYNSYQRLRLVEGIYVANGHYLPPIKKIISNPQLYACKLKNNSYVTKLLKQITLSIKSPLEVQLKSDTIKLK